MITELCQGRIKRKIELAGYVGKLPPESCGGGQMGLFEICIQCI